MTELKTASTLGAWLDWLGAIVPGGTQAVAHGGTALTLSGVKASTKDVDVAFMERISFEAVKGALGRKYRVEADMRQWGSEQFLRYRNPAEAIDVVDLRFPTWNSWRMEGLALAGCVKTPHGRLRLLIPDLETLFVFKSYPCRSADLSDVRTIVEKSPLRWDRVKRIYEEQEQYASSSTEQSGALLVAQTRGRAFACIGTLDAGGAKGLDAIWPWIEKRWTELRLPLRSTREVLELVNRDSTDWSEFLTANEARIAERVGI